MKILRPFLLSCGMLAGSLGACVQASTRQSVPADQQGQDSNEALDSFLSQFTELAMFDGTVIVDVAGAIVFNKSFGFADYQQSVRHSENTRFRLASVSKTLTLVALAKLIETGKLDPNVTIDRYLPDFPHAEKITVRHLAEHRSGIPHTNEFPWGDGTISLTLNEIVERLSEASLDFPPGTNSKYSNGGYAILARVIEVSGEDTFSAVMQDTVFGPLGMENTSHINDARALIPNMATGYEPGKFPVQRQHSRYYAVESRIGGGSFYSTSNDMLKFMRSVFRDDFISREIHQVLFRTNTNFLAQGRSPGFVAKILYNREADAIVVSLSNNYAVPSNWAANILAIKMDDPEQYARPRLLPEIERTVLVGDPLLGRYNSSFTDTETIIQRSPSGHLIIKGSNAAETAAIFLVDGSYIQPLYFQRCNQEEQTRIIECDPLSGDPRYRSTLTPIVD